MRSVRPCKYRQSGGEGIKGCHRFGRSHRPNKAIMKSRAQNAGNSHLRIDGDMVLAASERPSYYFS